MARAIGVTLDSYDMDFRSQEEKLITEAVKAIREDKARRKNFLNTFVLTNTLSGTFASAKEFRNGIATNMYIPDTGQGLFVTPNSTNFSFVEETVSSPTLSINYIPTSFVTNSYTLYINGNVMPGLSSFTVDTYILIKNNNKLIFQYKIGAVSVSIDFTNYIATEDKKIITYTMTETFTNKTFDLSQLLDTRYNPATFTEDFFNYDGTKLTKSDFNDLFYNTGQNTGLAAGIALDFSGIYNLDYISFYNAITRGTPYLTHTNFGSSSDSIGIRNGSQTLVPNVSITLSFSALKKDSPIVNSQ